MSTGLHTDVVLVHHCSARRDAQAKKAMPEDTAARSITTLSLVRIERSRASSSSIQHVADMD